MNLLPKIFRKEPRTTKSRAEITGYNAVFTAWTGGAYANDIFRGGVDAIARNAAKLQGTHVKTFSDGSTAPGNDRLNYLLQVQPNPYMSAYDLLYKTITRLYTDNNSFVYLAKDNAGGVLGLYPLNVSTCQFLADATGALYCEFVFKNGKTYTLPYSDVVHLRRHFANSDLIGESNDALNPALELAHTENEGIINTIKTGVSIRGILQFTQILSPEKLKENKDAFMSDYLQLENSGGVVATDQTMEYTPIDHKPPAIDTEETTATRQKIYNYLGITEKFVNSSYTDEEYSAVYESVLEPLGLQLSLEFTNKAFTPAQAMAGDRVEFKAARLQFISNSNKVQLLKECVPMGIIKINQALEILGLPPQPDGDRAIQSLNYIEQSVATNYQLDTKEGADGEGNAS